MAPLKKLQSLSLMGCRQLVGDRTKLKEFPHLPELEVLDLTKINADEDDLKAIAGLTNLRSLNLTDNVIRSLKMLAPLKKLTDLNLRELRPDLKVTHTPL